MGLINRWNRINLLGKYLFWVNNKGTKTTSMEVNVAVVDFRQVLEEVYFAQRETSQSWWHHQHSVKGIRTVISIDLCNHMHALNTVILVSMVTSHFWVPPPLGFIPHLEKPTTTTVGRFINPQGDVGPWPWKRSKLSGCWQIHSQ